MSMMRIAVAGTGGLAQLIAHFIELDTSHHVVFLSREEKPRLNESYQVAVVDYSDLQSLQFALRGIDTVISTVTGPNQIELIKAAVSVRVRRFAPAEFEGVPQLRPANDRLDRGRYVARQWLAHYAQHIQTTTFVCGILYERFQPGGLRQSQIGRTSGFSGEGEYIMDCRAMAAQVPCYDVNNDPNVTICLTAAQDVGKFVTKAIDLPQWPSELRMCGQRVLVKDLVLLVQRLKGRLFNPIQWHNPESLRSELRLAALQEDNERQLRLHTLIATAEGRYDFTQPNLNQRFPDVRVTSFEEWFIAKWSLHG
ncbi:hypothetical protein LTR36_001643 [Oleoguttula mirabilis]|uniref:NmrA-like domain-containing protein n=1 Tax=Oleoguttula mirabilis TaxID=1507867 RepID=A0AAV9JNF1_9PEZI|nr:hypothetical protein LTR36_001643 [Oleoguttula mirabilis]